MRDPLNKEPETGTRFAVIVPSEGSAYYLADPKTLIQVPLDRDGFARIASPDISQPDGAEVDFDRAFETPTEAERLRRIEGILRSLPDDATVAGADPVPVTRSDLSALLTAIGSARSRAADAYRAEARSLRLGGWSGVAASYEQFDLLLGRSAEQMIKAAESISVSKDPVADLADLMPQVRWIS